MKKIIILLLSILLITSCTNKEEIKENVKKEVETTIKDISNISIKDIEESYNYLKDNYQSHKDEKKYEKIIYHLNYLKELGKNNKENELSKLAKNISKYLDKPNKDNKKIVDQSIKIIDEKKDQLVNDLYSNYLIISKITNVIKEQEKIAESDINDPNSYNEENINKAIKYISNHIEAPLKNDEILIKITYYSLYLSKINQPDNSIVKIGTHTLNYLKTLDINEKNEVLKHLNSLSKNQNKEVKELYKETKSN